LGKRLGISLKTGGEIYYHDSAGGAPLSGGMMKRPVS
jgi:hypothetical protein